MYYINENLLHSVHRRPTHSSPTGHFLGERVHSAVPYSSGLLWMERDGAAHCLTPGSRSPDQSQNGYL